jgi:hypothetical protein
MRPLQVSQCARVEFAEHQSLLIRPRKHQSPKRHRHVKIGLRCPGRPPSRIKSWFHRAFHSKKIHAPDRCRIKSCRQTLHRQSHHRPPPFSRLVDLHPASQAAPQVLFLSRRDVQINPESIRSHLNFFIAPRLRRIALQKHLANIPLPQLIPPPPRIRIRKHRDAPIPRHESQVQSLRRPQHPHLRTALRVAIQPAPIRIESHRRRHVPRFFQRKSVRIGCTSKPHGDSCIRFHRITRFTTSDVATIPSQTVCARTHLAVHSAARTLC